MFKRISHIIVSVLLLIATTGFTSFRHFCGEQLISESIMSGQPDCCDDSSTCCHDEVESFHIDDDFFSEFNDYDFGQLPINLPVFYRFSKNLQPAKANPSTFIEGSPPQSIQTVLSSLQVYIL